MKRILRIDICDYKNKVLCNLYDSQSSVTGQAHDVFINYERNGWKELSFSIPSLIQTDAGEEPNYRLDYLVADFRLKVTENDTDVDWYLISEPKITHENFSKTVEVRAGHISQILKTKNLELEFSDENGNNVGTAEQFLTTILDNTGWTVGEVEQFKEDNGDIKIRTFNASAKTGALKMISDLCELFDAKAIYHGDTRTVDLLPLNPFSEEHTEGVPEEVTAENAIELHYSKNVKNITRTLNTENLITRLYAQGSYGNATTGICNIQTCSHNEYTFTGIQAGKEYSFKDDTNATFYFYVPANADVSGTVVWSKLDLLSRSYVWDESKEQFYSVTKKRQTDQTPVALTAEPEPTTNYLPFLMSFDYYRKIGLLNDEQFLELAKYQRELPKLYKASQDAAKARADKAEELSKVAEPRNQFLKLSVSTTRGDVTSEDGHLSLKINKNVGDNGVVWRSDYDESKRNYFSWYVAGELKENGDPISKLGGIVYIIHANDTWDTAYLEKIYNDEGLIVDEEGNPTHYYYALTDGSEPRRIVLHINYNDVTITEGDRFYLFCSNSMSGMLGVNMATDEAIVQNLQNQLTDETVKHPVFFTPVVDEALIDQIPTNEYGWLYQSSIRSNVEIVNPTLYYCNKGNKEMSWNQVFTGEDLPTFNRNRHNGNYFFNLKTKTLWLGGNSAWVQMTTKKDERMAQAFSTVITMCNQRERVYKGWYETYTRNGSLAIGNYAAKIGYDSFMLFSTDQQTADVVTIDTTNSWLYQQPGDSQSVVSVTTRTYDTVDFSVKNIFSETNFTNGNVASNGIDVSNDDYYRSGYVRVHSGVGYTYNVPANTTVYFYDQNKTFLSSKKLTTGSVKTFTAPAASDIPQTIETLNEYKAGAYWMRIASKVSSPSGFLNDTYYVQLTGYANKFVVNDKLYTVLSGFEGSGEQLGIDPLMPRFAALADETYGILLRELQEAQNAIKEANLAITDVLGDMLREGYWQDNNYAEGDEERLYKDAMDNLKEISKPETTYDIDFLDLYESNQDMEFSITDQTDVSWPDIKITDAVHLIDDDLDISCWGYINKLNKCFDQPWRTTLEINTKLTLIDQHDFTDVMAHIADVAKETKAKQTLYQRAAALTGSGQLAADRLSGAIKSYVTQIIGGASNWYTDEDGNQIFTSADGQSAMMLSGNGLCIANSKNKDGDWNWRTAATGSGIVADTITAGTLSAVLIQAGAITADKLAASVGQELEISSNVALTLYATASGSRPAGALMTGVQSVDEDGNPSYAKVGEDESYIQILPKTDDHEAQINIMSGGNVNIEAGSQLNLSGSTMSVVAQSQLSIESGGNLDIKSDGKFTVDSENFKIKENGNVEIIGKITATSGKIAGFIIGQETTQEDGQTVVVRDYLYSGTSSMTSNQNGVYLGTDGINVGGKFKVSDDGATLLLNGTGISIDAESGAITVKANSTFTVNANKTLSLVTTNAVVKIGHKDSPFTVGADGVGGTNESTKRSYIYNGVTGVNDTAHNGIYLGTDGIVLGKGVFTVSTSGAVTAKNIAISGGSITISKTVDGVTTTPFKVTSSGMLTSTSGTIGGWNIEKDSLHIGKDTKNDDGEVTSSTYVALSTGTYAIWAGRQKSSDAPFWVKNDGTISATKGSIGGWIIGSNYIGNGASLAKSTVGISTGSTSFFAGANGSSISSAKFKVTKEGLLTTTSALIGSWNVDDKYIYSGTSASTRVKLDGSSDTTEITWWDIAAKTSRKTSHMFAMWCGSDAADSAPFSVTKDGVVTIRKLRVNVGSDAVPKYVEVDFGKWFSNTDSSTGDDPWEADITASMGKLKFQTIKSISVSKTGRVTIYYTNNNGGTQSVGFNSASSATFGFSWTGQSVQTGQYAAVLIVKLLAGDGTTELGKQCNVYMNEQPNDHKIDVSWSNGSGGSVHKSLPTTATWKVGWQDGWVESAKRVSFPTTNTSNNHFTFKAPDLTAPSSTAGTGTDRSGTYYIYQNFTSKDDYKVYVKGGVNNITIAQLKPTSIFAGGVREGESHFTAHANVTPINNPIHFKRHSSSETPTGTWYTINSSSYDLTYYTAGSQITGLYTKNT